MVSFDRNISFFFFCAVTRVRLVSLIPSLVLLPQNDYQKSLIDPHLPYFLLDLQHMLLESKNYFHNMCHFYTFCPWCLLWIAPASEHLSFFFFFFLWLVNGVFLFFGGAHASAVCQHKLGKGQWNNIGNAIAAFWIKYFIHNLWRAIETWHFLPMH